MTTRSFARLSGSLVVSLLAAAAGGCGGSQPATPSGSGGDVGPGPTSPLCGSSSNNGAGGFFKGGPTATPVGASFSPFPPQFGSGAVTASVAPPAISGGTLRILADGQTAVAADPDRDRVYVVDLSTRTVRATVVLDAGDEPGRVVADRNNVAHVALRRGGALVSIDTATGAILQRRAVCAAPRGVAYDRGSDLVHVACADGQLVSLPAAGGAAVRTLALPNDLRDVVVDGSRLLVSRFLSAQLLTVESDGTVSGTAVLPGFRSNAVRGGQLFTAGVAWRTMEMPDGSGVMMLHQRGLTDEVQPVVGGYGGPDTCSGIVHPAVTMVTPDGKTRSGPAMVGMVLAVDMAISADAQQIAFVSAGNSTNTFQGDPSQTPALPRVFVSDTVSTTDDNAGCMRDGTHAPCTGGLPPPVVPADQTNSSGAGGSAASTTRPPPGGSSGTAGATGSGMAGSFGTTPTCGVPDPRVPQVVGQPIAVAFDGAGSIVVQSREPAMLAFPTGSPVMLSTVSRTDTGHLIFHSNAGGGLACASCHAEGNEDGRVWTFTCQGARRTQSLHAAPLASTAPYHWDGEETDMLTLMNDVFVGRMSGPGLIGTQIDALRTWIDAQPRVPRAAPADAAAVERGRVLFNDPRGAACASCHTGTTFTNNATVDVGTGRGFQVPSLVGIGTRGPFMHDGCAKTLRDRFDPACGGASHGNTANLTSGQIADLIAYMQSI